jgi:hypothetical protein
MAIGGGTDSLSQNIGNYQSAMVNNPEKQKISTQAHFCIHKNQYNCDVIT